MEIVGRSADCGEMYKMARVAKGKGRHGLERKEFVMKDSYVFYKDNLGKEYLEVFEQVEMYVLSQNVDEAATEERLGELLDIFLSAEKTGRSVSKITGNDIERFCKSFCSDFGTKNRILHVVDYFKSIAKVLVFVSVLDLVFYILEMAEGGEVDLLHSVSSLNVSGYIMGIFVVSVLMAVVNVVIRRAMFKMGRVSMKVFQGICCVVAVLSFLIVFSILGLEGTNWFACPIWVMLGVSAAYLVAYHFLRGRYVKRQKVKFLDMVNEEVGKEFPAEMEKKFLKAQKKNLKRGKGELSMEAFLEKEEKDVRLTEKIEILYYILPLAITLVTFIPTYLSGGFDGIVDMVVYVAIMLGIEYPLMFGMSKLGKSGLEERKKWIACKREELEQDAAGRNGQI